jgi:signal transduction histidine kinase
MPPAQHPEGAERARTNESLEGERRKADDELEKRTTILVEDADDIVTRARERADRVLVNARTVADEKLQGANAGPDERSAVSDERQREDEVLRDERLRADEELEAERDHRRRALAALLALEREETDYHLALERDRADVALRTRDDFLAIVTHDIRNMLGGLALSAASRLDVPAELEIRNAIARDAKRVQRYTARMSRLVGDLLDLVSIEAGRLAVVPQPHDATELVRETVDTFRALAAAKKISVRTEVHEGSLLAQYDHDRVLQVLSNLLSNALKFTREGGRIDIAVQRIEDEIRFGINDTGPGIAPDKLEVVFDRFWQGSQRSHAGLGLYISRCIVEAHGGRIWADSRLGEGSTFYFTLPAAVAPANPPEGHASDRRGCSKRRAAFNEMDGGNFVEPTDDEFARAVNERAVRTPPGGHKPRPGVAG